jgi:hypothetical protein
MILMVAFVLVAATVPLTGGDLTALGRMTLRWMPALFVTLVAQILVTTIAADMVSAELLSAVHVVTYLPAVAFVVVNRSIRGLPLLGLGGALNFAAIAANGGVMPSLPAAAAAAGHTTSSTFVNSAPSSGSPLWFLGDVFAWPQPLPLANVFSVGDLLLLVGAALVLHTACRQAPVQFTSWTTATPST